VATVVEQLNAALGGRYTIRQQLGAGGSATVFLADDLRHPRRVAIKVLRRELAAVLGRERFLREIQIASGLSHPHILPLYDSGVAGDLLYFVMPYAAGESVRQWLAREKQLPIADVVRVAHEIAEALDYAHRQGVVHRDIKPENILLQEQHAVLADFGIARAIVAAGGQKLTMTGVLIGTPAYMSPEQSGAGRDLDGRCDVYGLGCVVYEMLAGEPPFTGATAEILAHQHLNVPPRPVTDLRPTVPAKLASAIQRALAKAPADRFKTASEFVAALAIGAESETRAAAPVTRQRWLVPALSAAAIILVAFAAWRIVPLLLRGRTPTAVKKEWIMVADFDGPAEDPGQAAATRDLVTAALDQSASLMTVSRDQIRTAMQLAGRPPDTPLDAPLARELAYRRGIRAVVEGSIRRLGPGSAIVVRVVDVERDSVLFSVSDVAPNEKALIATIGRVTRRVREGMGERKDAIRASRELRDVRTASFDAFKEFRRGVDLLLAGDSPGSIARARAALVLDPDFAAAWSLMGYAFSNMGQTDSARAAWRWALSRPGRLDDRGRLLDEAAVDELDGNLALALATYDRLTEQEPTFVGGHGNRGYLLYRMGQYDAALSSFARQQEVSPFGPNQILLLNLFSAFLASGRLDQARATARELKGSFAQGADTWLAAASGNWALTESLGTALETSPTSSLEARRLGGLAVASAAATRGEVRLAEEALRRAEACAGAASQPAFHICVEAAPRALLLLALVAGHAVADPLRGWRRDSTTAAIVTRGLWMAAAGDTVGARRLLRTVRSRAKSELAQSGADPELLEASIAAREGRWDETLRILGPTARRGSEIGLSEDRAGRVTLRWLTARAFENLGRADSAAAYLEMVLSPLGRVDQEYFARGVAFSFAHRQLVMLYARMGRLEEARRHWEIFSATCKRPDPEVKPLIEEARAALASADGLARTARP
jgi:serine/threonine-protein kinase